jgi:hypothetical protein
MTETTRTIFDKYEIRKTRRQKTAFIDYVSSVSAALTLGLCLLLSLASCEVLFEETFTTTEENSAAVSTTEPPTEEPAPPPPLPTKEDLMAGYTYDWDPNGYTMEFRDEEGQFNVIAVNEIRGSHLIKYRDVMQFHEDFGGHVICLFESGLAELPELSAATDPAFFEVGNTFELIFTTLTYNTNMKLELAALTENGWRIVEELYPARGTTPMTVTYTVEEGDIGIALHWLTGIEPLYIGDLHVTLTPLEDGAS